MRNFIQHAIKPATRTEAYFQLANKYRFPPACVRTFAKVARLAREEAATSVTPHTHCNPEIFNAFRDISILKTMSHMGMYDFLFSNEFSDDNNYAFKIVMYHSAENTTHLVIVSLNSLGGDRLKFEDAVAVALNSVDELEA